MSTPLIMILIAGACLGGWALLSVLGAERQRMLHEMEATRRRPALPPGPAPLRAPPSGSGPAPAVGSATPAGKPPRQRPAGAAQNAR